MADAPPATRSYPLRRLMPRSGYAANELTRQDQYVDLYFGKEYGAGNPREVLTMTFQALLAGGYGDDDQKLTLMVLTQDPELRHLALGLLLDYEP